MLFFGNFRKSFALGTNDCEITKKGNPDRTPHCRAVCCFDVIQGASVVEASGVVFTVSLRQLTVSIAK